MATRLPDDFKEFLQLLTAKKIEYLVVGGFAVAFFGYPRATADIDIWIGVNPESAVRMVEALKEFGFGVDNLHAELFLKENQIVRMDNPPLRIEIMTTISGVSFDECYPARVETVVEGVAVNFINLDHLRINKAASGRPKDLDDLDHLPNA